MARGTWQGGGTWQTTGGGGGVLVLIAAAILIGSGAVTAAVSALVTILIVLACAAGLAVLTGLGWLIWRARPAPARSDRPGPPIAARPVYQLPPGRAPQLEESHKPAIEPPRETHLHFHVSAAELAAIMQHYTEEERP
jgi:hypothetical protein